MARTGSRVVRQPRAARSAGIACSSSHSPREPCCARDRARLPPRDLVQRLVRLRRDRAAAAPGPDAADRLPGPALAGQAAAQPRPRHFAAASARAWPPLRLATCCCAGGSGCPAGAQPLAMAPVLFDAFQIQLEQMLLADTLFTFLAIAAVTVLCWLPASRGERMSAWRAAWAVALLALAALTRPVGIPLIVIAVAYLIICRVGWRAITAACAAAVRTARGLRVVVPRHIRPVRARLHGRDLPVGQDGGLRGVRRHQAATGAGVAMPTAATVAARRLLGTGLAAHVAVPLAARPGVQRQRK